MDLESRKRALRLRMSERRRATSSAECARAGVAASREIVATPEFRSARRVALYTPLPGEVDTKPLFTAARTGGKQLCAPRCQAPDRLDFAVLESWAELRPAAFGVREPPPSAPIVALEPGDLVIVPGVAFDRQGRRLGRGGGYYDRAFPPGRAAAPRLFGLGFSFQVVAEVPSACHDRRMDAVCTEAGLLRPSGEGET